ncbi:Bleomycin hydrolase [Teratosphaeria destructans]|uniref:Cysteine proteinase 1, mitochondrial n=1 Tax=Teratosphaeria destructans TaxID=418781 RepID=A0A9W7SXH1_9PEZI|nr:Bleomycin hydrolase [Teratosphaeria destructans]
MGAASSRPEPEPEVVFVETMSRRHQNHPRGAPPPYFEDVNEKFEYFAISHDDHVGSTERRVLSTDDSETVNAAKTQEYVKELLKDSKNRLGLSALSSNNPSTVLEKPSAILKDIQYFNVKIPSEGSPVTNQRSSGRCWIFAATNVFRIAIQQKYDIKSFELSQAYLFFYDKVEKANYFLESMLETAGEPVDGRLISSLNASPVGDGGQWDMIVNLVSKYGIVPQALYPDSWNAKNSGTMDRLLTTKLREDGLKLRALKNEGASDAKIASVKEGFMQDVVRILTLTLGPPPATNKKFKWEFYDSKNRYNAISFTPLEFAASTHVSKFFSLVHDPRNEYNRLLSVDHLGNVWGGRPITYINVSNSVLKKAAVAMLQKGLPVFFGSDVGKFSDSSKGIMDIDLVDYELGFNVKLGLSKAERLLTGESQMTHAMVLTAVHLDSNGKPVRWRVENSWSESAGTDGYFVMSDKWMDEFVYQVVVDPSIIDKSVKDILAQKPKVLPLWDPMGALA